MADATLFLGGDVMIGRGIDQAQRFSCPPQIHESHARSAEQYVALAEAASGPMPRCVEPRYVWGDALAVLARQRPRARIINLETAITLSEEAEPKGINYRTHPGNVEVLAAARIDCCVLANNHVLDWGESGLNDTLDSLAGERIATAGAGRDADEARAPAVIEFDGAGRVLVFAFGATDSGIPNDWRADDERAGINLLSGFNDDAIQGIARQVEAVKRPGDLAIASIHWGGNWGYEIPADHRRFARALIDGAGIDLVHGHSSHHPKAIEVYRNRAILYGCGDLLNDYEGIPGYEEFRNDLVLMYFPTLDARTGELFRLVMRPMRIRRFRLTFPTGAECEWLRATLGRECQRFGHEITARADGALELEWR